MRRASWMSFGMIVTRFAWIAHKLVSSNKPTRYASDASCKAAIALDWNLKSDLKSCAISRTRRWKGSFLNSSSVDFWYLLISCKATVPGRYRCGFLTLPVAGALFLAALVAKAFLGALPPVDLRAVCFVLAITYWNTFFFSTAILFLVVRHLNGKPEWWYRKCTPPMQDLQKQVCQ